MKTILTTILFISVSVFSTCHAQTLPKSSDTNKTEKETIRKDSSKQMNMLDEQTKIFNNIFKLAGASSEENPIGGATNYLELIENLEGSEELKQELKEQYKLYDLGLDPKKKEEFKVMFDKKLKEAMSKGMVEDKQN